MLTLDRAVVPATEYLRADDLWIITTYFNPQRYITKRANYDRFITKIISGGLNYVVVELAFNDQAFELPVGQNILRIRGRAVMWQKERLLNVALASLPEACRKVVWLDCDIEFENHAWALEMSAVLDDYVVAQPYDVAVRLPKDAITYDGGRAITYRSFCAVAKEWPEFARSGQYDLHGHTGFAWGARRSLLQAFGFYDTCIVGNGDHAMAHGFLNDTRSRCLAWMATLPQLEHFAIWSDKVSREVGGRVSYVKGVCLHYWHGSKANRLYWERAQTLSDHGFDPATDLRIDSNGCWAWASDKPALHTWARDYFATRQEDGSDDDASNGL